MLIGYARVSSKEQNLDRQLLQLKNFGCEYIVEEKASGKNRYERQKFQELLQKIRFKDVIVVTELSRIARSLKDLLEIINELREKEVSFVSLKENIDTGENNFHNQFLLNLLGALAEYEHELIRERQYEGIELAKNKGKYTGKSIQYSSQAQGKNKILYDTVIKMLSKNESIMNIHNTTGLARNTIYRIKNEEQKKQNGLP